MLVSNSLRIALPSAADKIAWYISVCSDYNNIVCLLPDLVQCTNEPNVSIPQLANLLIERSQNTNWVVVYKALITVHHIMCHGNEVSINYNLTFFDCSICLFCCVWKNFVVYRYSIVHTSWFPIKLFHYSFISCIVNINVNAMISWQTVPHGN